MTPTESKRIFESACSKRAANPEGQIERQKKFERFHRVLRTFEAKDVEAALDEWWADSTPTSSGRVRGSFMPAPAELLPLIERIAAKREVSRREPQDVLYWTCDGGHRVSGFVARTATVKLEGRVCSCGAPLRLTSREAA